MVRIGLITLSILLIGLGLLQGMSAGRWPWEEIEPDCVRPGPPGPNSILILTGQNNHDCAFTSRLVKKVLEGTGRFRVTLTDEPAKALADAEALKKVDAFFLDYNGPRWGKVAEKNFLDAVRGGTGVVVMHAANNAFPGWTEYETLVGHLWRDGTGHGRFHPFDVNVDDANHPVTWDLPDLKAHPDELYHRLLHMHGAKFRQLMSAQSSKESGGTGQREPMAMVLQYGQGRIFHTPLGHVWRGNEASRASLRDPQLQCLLARGTEWAATGRVTLTPEDFGLVSPLRALAANPRFRVEEKIEGAPDEIRLTLGTELQLRFSRSRGALQSVWAKGGALCAADKALRWTLREGGKDHVLRVESFAIEGKDGDEGWRKGWPTLRVALKHEERRFVVTQMLKLPSYGGSEVNVSREFRVEGEIGSGAQLRLAPADAASGPLCVELIDQTQGAAIQLRLRRGL